MWVWHHCLAFGGACDPKSWVDLLEMLAATVAIFALIVAAFLLLASRG